MQADHAEEDRRIPEDLLAYDPVETFTKIDDYFKSKCDAMRSDRDAKKRLLQNSADIGATVERIYRDFLCEHVPASCDILQGGYIFDSEGRRSHQMDIIVDCGNTHRFRDSSGQACATLEGTVANVEITSYLDRSKIDAELRKFAFIPPTKAFRGIGNQELFKTNPDLAAWWSDAPLKAVVAFDGVDADKALDQINSFYAINSHVPIPRRVNVVHMLNEYCIIKTDFDVYPNYDPTLRGEYRIASGGRVDSFATALILTRISQLFHFISRNAFQANDLRRNMMRHLQ